MGLRSFRKTAFKVGSLVVLLMILYGVLHPETKGKINLNLHITEEYQVQATNLQYPLTNLTHTPTLGRFLACENNVDLVIFVDSWTRDWEQRNCIRNTWGSRRLREFTFAQVFFVVGTNRSDLQIQQQLQWEQDIHNDLIQGDFDESLWNTLYTDLKAIIWLKWFTEHCLRATNILSVNSQAFVDIIALQENIQINNTILTSGFNLVCTSEVVMNATVCQNDTYLISNQTRNHLMEHLEHPFGSELSPAPHFLASLSEEAGLSLISQPNYILSPDLEISDSSPIVMPTDEDEFDSIWAQFLDNHDLDPKKIPPVISQNFSTTSHTTYVIENPNFCTKIWPDIEILAVVHSNPSQGDFRDRIRATWGDPRIYNEVKIRPLFFVGRSPDPVVEDSLQQESFSYGDLVQTDFLDSYKNLTFKAISWMAWVESHCSQVKDLIKTDDDMIVDVFRLSQYLKQMHIMMNSFKGREHLKFHCYYWRYGTIIRDPDKKHYVSQETFSGRRFPAYCSGSAFILSTKISQVLLDNFRQDPHYLWIDDVFITGILAKRAGVKHHSMGRHFILNAKDLKSEKNRRSMIFAHISGRGNHQKRMQVWNDVMSRNQRIFAPCGVKKLDVKPVKKRLGRPSFELIKSLDS
ncbi:hypothetical protein TCAL_11075 [Tigriopus californicus]|uniref:Hexosyltransferase n=1 Tax=Tigriopus californicus TaxID=6832 RepID=A0A553N6P6_TIGCA|nr:uncharacterized protein LOC131885732 [Tigriopus californicus]TRY61115.1 hypothetical protein TCAL_11075 [Tigriopus californicus]|eukprot:TCALIF_11075-PA protein Name:"Similar to B3GALT1 Beta-1,3-galactosyltransferase 1 (Pongo pygmaeus)" AED:0.07 eAED:0.07 QI:0/1/0.5/1/1/1/2/59/633